MYRENKSSPCTKDLPCVEVLQTYRGRKKFSFTDFFVFFLIIRVCSNLELFRSFLNTPLVTRWVARRTSSCLPAKRGREFDRIKPEKYHHYFHEMEGSTFHHLQSENTFERPF